MRALVLGATTCALLVLAAGPAHADTVGDLVDTVQSTVDTTVDTVESTLDGTVDTVHDAVGTTVTAVHDTVGGAVHPGTDEPAPDPTTPEGPAAGGGTSGSGGGQGSGGGHASGPTATHGTVTPPAAAGVTGPALLERSSTDTAPADPTATGTGGSLLDGSLTPPRGPTEPGAPGFGTAQTRFALSLLVAAIAVLVLFHAGALWLRMADQPSSR
jgi:hypothetical protein